MRGVRGVADEVLQLRQGVQGIVGVLRPLEFHFPQGLDHLHDEIGSRGSGLEFFRSDPFRFRGLFQRERRFLDCGKRRLPVRGGVPQRHFEGGLVLVLLPVILGHLRPETRDPGTAAEPVEEIPGQRDPGVPVVECHVVRVFEREGVDPVRGAPANFRTRIRQRQTGLDVEQLAVECEPADRRTLLAGEFHQRLGRQHPRQRIRQFQCIQDLDRLRLLPAYQRVDSGAFHRQGILRIRQLAAEAGNLHSGPQDVETRGRPEFDPVAGKRQSTFAGFDRLAENIASAQPEQIGIEPGGGVARDPVLHFLEIGLDAHASDFDPAKRRAQAETPKNLGSLEVPQIGAEGERTAEIPHVAAPEGRGARIVDEPGKEGTVPESRVAGLGELQVEVELGQVGRARLPDQTGELVQALAIETHFGVQLGSDIHRLGNREGKGFLCQEVAVLVQNPIGDGAFPRISWTLARTLGGSHPRQRQQERHRGNGSPAGVATCFEKFHRFSFLLSTESVPPPRPDRARSSSGRRLALRPVAGVPSRTLMAHAGDARSGNRNQRSSPFVCSAETLARRPSR